MRRVLAMVRRRRAIVVAVSACLLLAGLAAATPGAFGGYSAKILNSTDTAASATYFKCLDALAADKSTALFQWPLGDATNATSAADVSGSNHPGTYQGSVVATTTTPIGCPRDAGTAWKLDGTSSFAYYPTAQNSPQTFTIEVDFQTSAKAGRLIGFGSSTTGLSAVNDRMIYINTDGAVAFGTFNGATHVITSTTVVTDNAWHDVAATMSTGGMKLYLDGKLVGTDATTTAETNVGYWRVGYDNLNAWPKSPTSFYFSGRMRYAAVYTTALTATQLQNHAAALN